MYDSWPVWQNGNVFGGFPFTFLFIWFTGSVYCKWRVSQKHLLKLETSMLFYVYTFRYIIGYVCVILHIQTFLSSFPSWNWWLQCCVLNLLLLVKQEITWGKITVHVGHLDWHVVSYLCETVCTEFRLLLLLLKKGQEFHGMFDILANMLIWFLAETTWEDQYQSDIWV